MQTASPAAGIIFLVLILLVPIVLALLCMLNLEKRDFSARGRKLWMVILLTLPFLGPVLYLALGVTRSTRTD